MNDVAKLHFSAEPCTGPCFYRTSMRVDKAADTYIDTSEVHKGFSWINGRPLGRIWSIGPQHTLFTPGPWLKSGQNEIVFFDLMGTPAVAIKSVNEPEYGPAISLRN
jgi:beta-galactosidase